MTTFKTRYFEEINNENMDVDLLKMLDQARQNAGIPFIINSAYRTPEQNRRAGGKRNSAHLTGNAVDIRATNSTQRFKILYALIMVGFERIGIHKRFIHADNDKTKPKGVVWMY